MSFLDFNVADLPESTNSYEPLPAGWYTATINAAELKDTNAGTGQYISVTYAITGPSHQGRSVFGNLNIKNPNPKAEEIGRQQLGDLMRAIGLTRVTDTDQLIGGQLSIKLKVRPASEKYDASNDVSGYKALDGGIKVMPTAQTQSQAAQQPAGTAPWLKQ